MSAPLPKSSVWILMFVFYAFCSYLLLNRLSFLSQYLYSVFVSLFVVCIFIASASVYYY